MHSRLIHARLTSCLSALSCRDEGNASGEMDLCHEPGNDLTPLAHKSVHPFIPPIDSGTVATESEMHRLLVRDESSGIEDLDLTGSGLHALLRFVADAFIVRFPSLK